MADDTFPIKRNDTWRPLRLALEEATIEDPDPNTPEHWAPMDLSNVQVAHVWMKSGNVQIRTSPVEILDATLPDPLDDAATEPVGDGHVAYYWQSPSENPDGVADTGFAGTYEAEVELIYMDGEIETVPRTGYFTIIVNPDLGQAT